MLLFKTSFNIAICLACIVFKIESFQYCICLPFPGETSAGKSTLINKILQKKIFIGHTIESTSTICKIRNLDRVRIITKCKDGQIDEPEIDLTERCDLTSECGVELLRTHLTELTDRTLSDRSFDFEFVDVGFPIPFLKVLTGFTFDIILTGRLNEQIPVYKMVIQFTCSSQRAH